MGFQKGHIQLNTGRTHFKKGHAPWNKGVKGIRVGKKAFHWKGGKIKRNGYWNIHKPEHLFADKQGYIRQSRLVMEKKIGRYLKPEEIVHHINGNIADDRPENLELFINQSKHGKHHFPKGSKLGINQLAPKFRKKKK